MCKKSLTKSFCIKKYCPKLFKRVFHNCCKDCAEKKFCQNSCSIIDNNCSNKKSKLEILVKNKNFVECEVDNVVTLEEKNVRY